MIYKLLDDYQLFLKSESLQEIKQCYIDFIKETCLDTKKLVLLKDNKEIDIKVIKEMPK